MTANSKTGRHPTAREADTDAFNEPLSEDAVPGVNMPHPGLKPPPVAHQKPITKVQTMRLPQDLIDALESTLKALKKQSVQDVTKSDLMRAFLSMGIEKTTEALRTDDTTTIIEVLTWAGTEYKES